jgi:hypothetical protein
MDDLLKCVVTEWMLNQWSDCLSPYLMLHSRIRQHQHCIWANSIHFTSARAISIKTHFYSAWSSFPYEDGHINVCTAGRIICQVPKTVYNYCNENSEVYIINQALLYIPPKIPLKFQRENDQEHPVKNAHREQKISGRTAFQYIKMIIFAE